jgi:hypothetical protein
VSFKVIRLTVGKGLTSGDEKDQKWIRQYFELEAEIQSEHEIERAKSSMEALIDTWLKGELVNPPQTARPQETAAIGLPGVDLAKLPWKSYQTKQDAKENEAAWIFSNTAGAEALLATLKAKDGKTRIGDFDYQIQGQEKQFISRKPVKTKN